MPNICGVLMKRVEGQYVLLKLNEAGICISTGSACDIHSESGTKAILSMGYSMEAARQFLEYLLVQQQHLRKLFNYKWLFRLFNLFRICFR